MYYSILKYVNQIENKKSEEKREQLNQTGQNFSGIALFDEMVVSIKMSVNIRAVFRAKQWPLWEDERCSGVGPYSGLDSTK